MVFIYRYITCVCHPVRHIFQNCQQDRKAVVTYVSTSSKWGLIVFPLKCPHLLSFGPYAYALLNCLMLASLQTPISYK